MRDLKMYLRPTLGMLTLISLLTGAVYPLLSTAFIQLLFPAQAAGSLIVGRDGTVLGSELIGQPFARPENFWGRLSATSPTPYNGLASSGSNFSPANPALLDAAKARIAALHAADPDNAAPIPVDLVTASASGLDPEISPAAAAYQVQRVARARRLDPAAVQALVERYTRPRSFGLSGEPGVNVLLLNLALAGKI